MMRKDIQKLYEKHKTLVKVCCDDYHSHTATKGCLSGPEASIDVCVMYEYILKIEGKFNELKNAVG